MATKKRITNPAGRPRKPVGTTKRHVTVSLSPETIADMDQIIRKLGVDRSALITSLVAKELKRLRLKSDYDPLQYTIDTKALDPDQQKP